MERDYENRHRQQSRITINDYPSSHLPPPQRPKLWGEASVPAVSLPQRALSYVERPCIPRETTTSDKPKPSQKPGLLSTSERTRPQPSSGDKCRQGTDGIGVGPAHCSPCYVMSSALSAGDRPSGSAQAPNTAAEVMQLSALVSKELERAAMSGCGSSIKPTTTAKPVIYV